MAQTDSIVPPVSLDAIELFLTIAKCGTIAHAARELGMVPSVATRKIAGLETLLSTKLFERTTRRIHLTEAGVVALDWARGVMDGYENLADGLASLRGSPSGIIRLVMNEYIATALLPEFLAQFSQRYPNIHYTLTLTDGLVDPDERGYDVSVHSGRVPESGLTGIRVLEMERLLCASPEYLARRGTPTCLADLEHHDCLAHRQAAGGVWHFRQEGRIIRQSINQWMLADCYMALWELARKGLGVMRVSAWAVRDDLAAGRLVRILPEYENVYPDGALAGIWILYPNRSLLHRTRLFVTELTAYLRKIVDPAASRPKSGALQ